MFGINDQLKKLEKRKERIRVAEVGAGAAGLPFVDQVEMSPGMQMDIVVDLNLSKAKDALIKAGVPEKDIVECSSCQAAEKAIKNNKRVIAADHEIAWNNDLIDVVCEGTGSPRIYAEVVLNSIQHNKHIVTMNAEGDNFVGSILNRLAKNAGVVYTGIHGDEPGIIKALYDEVTALGFKVLAAGRSGYAGDSIKWNKNTIKDFRIEMGMGEVQYNMAMLASFCDGTKTAEELCQLSNSIGLPPDVRGMHGPDIPLDELTFKLPQVLDLKEKGGILNRTGVVERVLHTEQGDDNTVICFVIVKGKNKWHDVFMSRYGLTKEQVRAKGDNTNIIFYSPYHYVTAQAPISVAYAAIHNQATIAPLNDVRTSDVITLAKKDLTPGEEIDEIGGVCTAGRIEKASTVKEENLLPFALAQGAILKKEVSKGTYLTFDDVELKKEDNLLFTLRQLQDKMFSVK